MSPEPPGCEGHDDVNGLAGPGVGRGNAQGDWQCSKSGDGEERAARERSAKCRHALQSKGNTARMDSAPAAALPCAHVTIRPSPAHGCSYRGFHPRDRGSLCTQMLSDMGAEVIKIENPDGGDDTRKGAGPRAGGETGESHFFMTFNRGKKSVALDFTKPDGQKIVHKLLEKADVMIENFRPGVLKKYGLDWTSVQRQVPEADLPLDLGLRPDRAAVGPAGLRSGAAGRVGHDERERRGQRRGAAPCHRDRRHHDRRSIRRRRSMPRSMRAPRPARASRSTSRCTTPRSPASATWARTT